YRALPANDIPVSLWSDRDAALTEVVQGIRQVIEELASQKTTHASSNPRHVSIYNPPYTYNDLFTDRTSILGAISSFFASAQPRRTPILALNGLGGMGKTQIALEYSYHSSDLYQAILWLNASSRTVLSTEVSTLANQLAL